MLSEPAPRREPIGLFGQLEAERPALLAAVAARLDGWRIPGGDVAGWLAGVPVLLIAECLRGDRAAIARRLLLLVGRARGAGLRDRLIDLTQADLSHVPHGVLAEASLQVWARCQVARISLEAGRRDEASAALRTLVQEIAGMPAWIGPRFLATADSLIGAAEKAARLAASHEVA